MWRRQAGDFRIKRRLWRRGFTTRCSRPRPGPYPLPCPPYLILLASGVEDTKRRTLEDPAGCLLDLSREAPVPRLLGIRGGQLHALGPMAALKGGSLTPGAPWWDIRGCGPPEDYHATTGRRAGAGG